MVSEAYRKDMEVAKKTANSVLENGKRRLAKDMAEERVELNSLRSQERNRRNRVNSIIRNVQREEEEFGALAKSHVVVFVVAHVLV